MLQVQAGPLESNVCTDGPDYTSRRAKQPANSSRNGSSNKNQHTAIYEKTLFFAILSNRMSAYYHIFSFSTAFLVWYCPVQS